MTTFASLVRSRFLLHVDSKTSIEVELVELKPGPSATGYEQFSLIFQGPADGSREQRIYELEHEATGTLELFLVPSGLTESGLLYAAVFSRRTEATAGGD